MTAQRRYDDAPHLDGLPVLNNTLEFFDGLLGFVEACHELGDVVAFSLVDTEGLVVADPALVKQVLVTDQEKFRKGEFTRQMFDDTGVGLFIERGDAWADRRRLLQPAFRPAYIQEYRDRIVENSRRVADDLAASTGPVAVEERMKRLSLSVLTTTLFGVNHDDALYDRIAGAVPGILDRMDSASLNSVLPVWVPTPRNRRFKRAFAEMCDIIDELIERHRTAGGTSHDHDLLSILVDALEEGEIDRETLRADMVTFTIAGHDTTALSLTYALYLLGTHPDVAERLRAELDEVLGGEPPTFAQFDELELLDRVIAETLRLYPPAATIARETTDLVELGRYEVPAGVTVLTPQWLCHRDGRTFDAPSAFRPDRWTEAFEQELPEYAYFPFGGGPRHCIGMRFAMAELKIALSVLLQRLDFEPVEAGLPDLTVAITLQPESAVRMTVTEQ